MAEDAFVTDFEHIMADDITENVRFIMYDSESGKTASAGEVSKYMMRNVHVDTTLTEEGSAAEAKAVGDALATKADTKGRYEDLIVGGAEQLMADGYETDTEPYLFRPTGGSADVGNREYLDKIVGGTVAWNQMLPTISAEGWEGENNSSISVSGTIIDTTFSSGDPKVYLPAASPKSILSFIAGHKYLGSVKFKSTKAGYPYFRNNAFGASFPFSKALTEAGVWKTYETVAVATQSAEGRGYFGQGNAENVGLTYDDVVSFKDMILIDLTAMFGSTIADYIYSLEQATAGAGVAWFKKLFPKPYYAYNAGELMSVNTSAHNTVGFNAFDVANADLQQKAWENIYTVSQDVHTEGYTKVIGGATYCFHQNIDTQGRYIRFYDADYSFLEPESISIYNNNDHIFTVPANAMYLRLMWYDANGVSVAEVADGDICINLSDPSRNGEYEPYQKHTYPLDNSLTLRGIPKLDSSNNLYYDGDTYESDGTVTRKYGVVDLGTLNWNYDISVPRFYSRDLQNVIKKASSATEVPNALCPIYQAVTFNWIYGEENDKGITVSQGGSISVRNTAYTTAADFKSAMSGVYLVYELATPTTETADGYEHYQICDPSGTEEFVTTGIVPVGHETRYPHDLKKKIESAPDSPSADGTYLMKRSGGKNAYMALPSTPSANGSYVLTVTVSGGTASYSWTAKE